MKILKALFGTYTSWGLIPGLYRDYILKKSLKAGLKTRWKYFLKDLS